MSKWSVLNISLLSDRNNLGYCNPAHCNRNKLCARSVTFLTFFLCCCLYILNSRIFSRKTRPTQQIFVKCPSTFYPTHNVRFIRIFARDLQSVNSITCKRWDIGVAYCLYIVKIFFGLSLQLIQNVFCLCYKNYATLCIVQRDCNLITYAEFGTRRM